MAASAAVRATAHAGCAVTTCTRTATSGVKATGSQRVAPGAAAGAAATSATAAAATAADRRLIACSRRLRRAVCSARWCAARRAGADPGAGAPLAPHSDAAAARRWSARGCGSRSGSSGAGRAACGRDRGARSPPRAAPDRPRATRPSRGVQRRVAMPRHDGSVRRCRERDCEPPGHGGEQRGNAPHPAGCTRLVLDSTGGRFRAARIGEHSPVATAGATGCRPRTRPRTWPGRRLRSRSDRGSVRPCVCPARARGAGA